MAKRPTLREAQRDYPHRFTMDHVPHWARNVITTGPAAGKYYAPQFRSDAEWYANTMFPGEPDNPMPGRSHCFTRNHTWPLGQWLDAPYRKD